MNQAELKLNALKNSKPTPTPTPTPAQAKVIPGQDDAENLIEKPLDEEKPNATNVSATFSALKLSQQ
jgi:hypothetical protein